MFTTLFVTPYRNGTNRTMRKAGNSERGKNLCFLVCHNRFPPRRWFEGHQARPGKNPRNLTGRRELSARRSPAGRPCVVATWLAPEDSPNPQGAFATSGLSAYLRSAGNARA